MYPTTYTSSFKQPENNNQLVVPVDGVSRKTSINNLDPDETVTASEGPAALSSVATDAAAGSAAVSPILATRSLLQLYDSITWHEHRFMPVRKLVLSHIKLTPININIDDDSTWCKSDGSC